MSIPAGIENKYINAFLSDQKMIPLIANPTLQGIENNIHVECVSIQEVVCTGNTGGIHMHDAVLSQLIPLKNRLLLISYKLVN